MTTPLIANDASGTTFSPGGALPTSEIRVLELVATGAPLRDVLDEVTRLVEEQVPGSLCSILLLDPDGVHLRHGSARSLPTAYNAAVDGITIGPVAGSCGTAAFRRETVVVADISTDPLWASCRDVAGAHGLRACWSVPFFASRGTGRVLGTFAVYHREPRSPDTLALGVVARASYLTGVAVERDRAEAELRESEARLRVATEAAQLGTWDRDLRVDRLVWSAAQERLMGFEPGTFPGTHEAFDTLVHPDDRAALDEARHRAREGKGEYQAELRFIRPDGSVRWGLVRGQVLLGADGRPERIVGVHLDITDRRRAEDELRMRDRAMQAVSQGILITDPTQPDNPVIYASPGFERLAGYSATEVVGRNCRFLQGKDTDPAIVREIREAVAAGRPCAVELLNYRKDGTAFWNALTVSPVRDDAGRVTHFVGTQTDVSERRRLEVQFQHAQKLEAVGRLAGGIAHDFNNLLTVIVGYSDLLIDSLNPADPLCEALVEVREAGRRGAALTRQLLAFSRKMVLVPRVIDLNALLTDMGRLLGRLLGEDIDLRVVTTHGLWRVRADPAQVEQVVMNLVVNSRDAMPRGGKLTVETRNVELDATYIAAHQGSESGRFVLLAVSDTGHGMDAATRARIFEPFFTTKPPEKGTGLGRLDTR